MGKRFDLAIIGGGAAAFAAAMKANELGIKTVLIEQGKLGGTCVNVGCLPTKHLLYVGEVLNKTKHHGFNGLQIETGLDFSSIIQGKDKLVSAMRHKKYEQVLEDLKHVTLIKETAEFLTPNKLKVGKDIVEAEKFLIATGSSTYIPPIEGINKVGYVTNVEALDLKQLPNSVVVLGGGALGVEFAQMFARFGSKVCLLQSANRLVPREEPELAKLLQKYLEEESIEICTDVEIKRISKRGNVKVVTAIVNGKEKTYEGEVLLLAAGRMPNTAKLNLEMAGVKTGKKGEVLINEWMRTTASHIYAAGDVKGEPMLETVAAKEGRVAAINALSNEKKTMDYSLVPHAVFTDPQLAGVGLTDEQAQQKRIKCSCRTIPLELVPKAVATNNTQGAIKMVIDEETKKVLGVHILSPIAADLIHEATFIIKAGMTIYDVIDTLHVFPTMSEAIKMAAQSFTKDVSKMACCVE